MTENDIISKWNSGNFYTITQDYKLNTIISIENIFFFIDSFIQQNLFEKAEDLIAVFFSSSKKGEEERIVKNLLSGRLLVRLFNNEEVIRLLNEIYLINTEVNEWYLYCAKQLEAFVNYAKTDFGQALKILGNLEVKYQDIQSYFPRFNMSYHYSLRGVIEWKLGETQKALDSLTKSKTLNEKFNNKIKLANDYYLHGLINLEMGDFIKGLIDFEEADALYNRFNDEYGKKLVILAIAEVKFLQGKFNEALSIYKSLLSQFTENKSQMSELYYLIGKIYQKKGELTKAQENYERSIEISTKIETPFYQSVEILTMIDLLVEKKEYEKISYYSNLFIKETDNKTIQAIKLMIQALIYQTQNKYKEAIELWIEISADSFLPINLKLYSLENGLKTSITIWKENKDIILLKEIESIIEKWEKISTDNSLISSLAMINLLKAKFFLALLEAERAEKYLEEGLKLAHKCDLEINENDIKMDRKKIFILKNLEKSKYSGTPENQIELDEVLDYLKNIKTNLLVDKKR